ncbi:hypothetical protein [Geoalkalibacter halelectricus]|uniref:Uncharacterized protein n=1 Tax=Geoalkalibacter halelectricus TaxID=2847045 RepID=A0ABY5ZPF4_9BACT|nr:hypothetical protein [Geoalkalibacter halelectricus]MDO3379270.1 hypothetical protein [Geoalkalibacter halelectricus]UWZ81027.1 hypothetical protein L9S41_06435 [Geoalkalibacter halelectricus]
MGFLDKIFGGKPEYPQLDTSSPAAGQIEHIRNELERLSAEVKQPLEVIPGEDSSYVFIGKPPKKFGVAWIEEGRVHNFKTLVEENGVEPSRLTKVAEELREIYEANQQGERFTAKVGDQDLVVTPSDVFRNQVRETIEKVLH